ncbi:MAG: hypothetical protein ACOX2L_11525 [Anaerolineae bacterium]|jgi:hypothetical protein|nr:hypothetical protein [Chloroflexota bacterium]
MTQETTAASTIRSLESRLERLTSDAQFTDVQSELTQTDGLLSALPGRVAALRTRKYVYNATLEKEIADLAERWPAARRQAEGNLQLKAASLRPAVSKAATAVAALAPLREQALTRARATIDQAEAELKTLSSTVEAQLRSIEGGYKPLADAIDAVANRVQHCERNLDLLDGATFQLAAGESLVEATQAWLVDGKEETEGVLFATDQRLLFERREKVARRKILFITTSSELVKELLWEAPMQDLERIDASEARQMLRRRELITLTPRSGASAATAQFRLQTDSDGWRATLLRIQNGEIDATRDANAPAPVEYIVPSKCPTCGGALSKPGRIRGVSSVACEYCGANIVLEKAS